MTAVATNVSPLPRGAVAIHAAVCLVEDVLVAVSEWNRRRMTRAQLGRLSRAQLADIGLEGADLDAVATRSRA